VLLLPVLFALGAVLLEVSPEVLVAEELGVALGAEPFMLAVEAEVQLGVALGTESFMLAVEAEELGVALGAARLEVSPEVLVAEELGVALGAAPLEVVQICGRSSRVRQMHKNTRQHTTSRQDI
jgi:hypothetical protein